MTGSSPARGIAAGRPSGVQQFCVNIFSPQLVTLASRDGSAGTPSVTRIRPFLQRWHGI